MRDVKNGNWAKNTAATGRGDSGAWCAGHKGGGGGGVGGAVVGSDMASAQEATCDLLCLGPRS
jgi:hypothetical protein